MPEDQVNIKTDKYLESPKAFHLEMPLYHDFDLSVARIEEKIFKLLSYRATIDAYCIWCEKEGVFRAYEYLSDNASVPRWINRHDGLIEIEYRCARIQSHAYHTYYFKDANFFTKVGQYPSVADFQIPQAAKYRKILGESEYREFTRGIGLSAHGVGIGSFVYLRRVFEKLIQGAHQKAKSEDKTFSEEKYILAPMDDKIKMVRKNLPEFLVENRKLYAILSKGIHDLSEDECLQYFETVKIGIEQILDEKIVDKEKADKNAFARAAIRKTHGKLTIS